MAERKIKEIGTYEVKYNKQLRGRESEAFSYNLLKKSQNKGCFLAFFSFLFVKKNKMPDLGSNGWEERRGEGEGGEAGGVVWQGQ